MKAREAAHVQFRERLNISGTECQSDLHIFEPHAEVGTNCQCGEKSYLVKVRSTYQFIKSCRRVRGLPCSCMEPHLVEVLCSIG